VLAITHGPTVGPGIFRGALEGAGHELEEWSIVSGDEPAQAPEEYDAVITLGGAMHPDQEERHPWLRDEDAILRRVIDRGVPTLGVCLGAQLLAKAADGRVYRAAEREVGFMPCELTDAGLDDPVVGVLPERFLAFDWHEYTWDTPAHAVELARTERCSQAFRVGDVAWGVQFHAEVDRAMTDAWLQSSPNAPAEQVGLARELDAKLGAWQELGRALCFAFAAAAERVLGPSRR
jgi:GMP synthase-like glutamine amidotransferase